ncbi:MAG: DUF4405 domain-containing protein [Planctomycetes bacterium]|nr:DUF4405 domain-containing protein [Planctomycetota bacterium]
MSKKAFNKTKINFWVDVLLLVVFLLLCWASVVTRYVFPVATLSEGWTLWGLDYLAWTDIQFAILCAMLATVLLHVMLHWTWVCGVIESWNRKRRGNGSAEKADTGNRTLWGVGFLIVLLNVLGLGIAVAALSVQQAMP